MFAECRKLLVQAKQKYKKVENRLKRQYKGQEGDMLEYLRKITLNISIIFSVEKKFK